MADKTYPIVWVGSLYTDEVQSGFPCVQILLPPGEATDREQVEAVVETMSATFLDIIEGGVLDLVHPMISKWRYYAQEQGYAFDYDKTLYERSGGRWRVLTD